MIKHQLTVPVWLSLGADIKAKLIETFKLKKTGGASFTQVGGRGIVTSDGFTHDDLSVITVERIAELLNKPINENFWESFEDLLKSFEPKAEEPVVEEPKTEEPKPLETVVVEEKPRRGRPPKIQS